jgi:hypothetical protein
MRKLFIFLAIFITTVSSLQSEDIEKVLRMLEEKALKVHISARVIENGDVSVWNMDISKITISGKTVNVRLRGDDILVYANITPYTEGDNSILLVAQGQVWINSPDSQQVKYKSTIKSLPITVGEKVLFYPLGVADPNQMDIVTVELAIEVTPYHKIMSGPTD